MVKTSLCARAQIRVSRLTHVGLENNRACRSDLMAADMEVKESTAEVVAVDKIKVQPQNKATRGFNQKFLDLFWRLAENDAGARLNASIELIKQLDSAQCTVKKISFL